MSLVSLRPATSLTIAFGHAPQRADAALRVGLTVLGGEPVERLFPTAVPAGVDGSFELYRTGSRLLGCAARPVGADLETVTRELYEELIAAARGWHLCRIWNYVPAINALDAAGLENYRAFSRGRSLAFEQAFGPAFKRHLPAASAVGTADGCLSIVFAASLRPPVHCENPQQLPAYDYPVEHGPRAPSFARASIVPGTDGRMDVFIAGTSAIKGHATIAPGDTRQQTHCTLENLRAIAETCGLDADLAAGRSERRHIKVYLRHGRDHDMVARELFRTLVQPSDSVTYLVADICREALNVEIEVSVFGAQVDASR